MHATPHTNTPSTSKRRAPSCLSVPERNGRPRTAGRGTWTPDEHARFCTAMTLFPRGPWSAVAEYVGTRSARQAITHAQKETQRLARHERGLKPSGRPRTRRPPRCAVRSPPGDASDASTSSWSDDSTDSFIALHTATPYRALESMGRSESHVHVNGASSFWKDLDVLPWEDFVSFLDQSTLHGEAGDLCAVV